MTFRKQRRSGLWSCGPCQNPPNMLWGFCHFRYSCLQYLEAGSLKCPKYKAIWRSCQVSYKKKGRLGYQSSILLMGWNVEKKKILLVLSFTRAHTNESKKRGAAVRRWADVRVLPSFHLPYPGEHGLCLWWIQVCAAIRTAQALNSGLPTPAASTLATESAPQFRFK